MGTWGSGSFDNDDAADWAYQLTPDADEGVVIRALAAAESDDDPDASVGQSAIAAAEVVAAGLGRPAADLPEAVTDWVSAHTDRPWASVAPLALRAIARLVAGSELRELWEESDEGGDWNGALQGLRDRLTGTS